MSLYYFSLFFMLLVAIGMLSIPFWQHKITFRKFLLTASMLGVGAASLYALICDYPAISYWLTQGKQHYQLVETFNQLGGIEGAIAQIEAKLKNAPNDKDGWIILGKLYLSKGDKVKAKAAFLHAKALAPENQEVLGYMENTK